MNKQRSVFIDCGAHQLEGIHSFCESGLLTKDFEVYMFEPNPACDILNRIKESTLLKNIFINFHPKAVWDQDITLKFNQEHHKISKSHSPSDGRSDRDGWASSVDGELEHRGYLSQIEVQGFDFSKFLSLFNDHDNITCKMDIEGSEYKVLRRIISTGQIKKINSLFIEFHSRFKPNESVDSTISLIKEILSFGVNLYIGDPLLSWKAVTIKDDLSKLHIS